eukprot:IDg1852t1
MAAGSELRDSILTKIENRTTEQSTTKVPPCSAIITASRRFRSVCSSRSRATCYEGNRSLR